MYILCILLSKEEIALVKMVTGALVLEKDFAVEFFNCNLLMTCAQNKIHFHRIGVETEISGLGVPKPEQIKQKTMHNISM